MTDLSISAFLSTTAAYLRASSSPQLSTPASTANVFPLSAQLVNTSRQAIQRVLASADTMKESAATTCDSACIE
jgi:hypothetical protein